MYSSLLWVLVTLVVQAALSQKVQIQSVFDPNVDCSPEGAEITRANVYFRCSNKTLKAAGCLGHNGTRVPLNSTYKAFNNFDMFCKPVSRFWAQLVPLTCWLDNLQYKPGETWVEGHFWYTCEKTSSGVRSKLSGCVGEEQEKIVPGGYYRRGNFVYTCTPKGESGIVVEPVACIYNDMKAKVGERLVGPRFVFTCTLQNNYIRLTPSACVVGNKTVELNENFIKDGFVYMCMKKDNMVSHTIVGCVQKETGKPYAIGQKWIDGKAPYRFVSQCIRLKSGYVYKQSVQCAVDHPDGRAIINPGCMKKIGKQLVQCYSPDFGSIAYSIKNVDEPNVEKIAKAMGLEYC